ncbi:hypothetical protein BDW22DRAFT_739437 [Trametopsis cervina]|nr:hypothetical protein BDW22DRAFT_739437 [Trametopsis cervina]
MKPAHIPEVVPPAASSEPSEPSAVIPEDKSREQLTGEQGENPQVMAHRPGKQAGDSKEGKGEVKGDNEGDQRKARL